MGAFKSLYFRKYKAILDYLTKDCAEIIHQYESIDYVPSEEIPKRIWTLWWKGEMPIIPATCVKRLQTISGYETILLTKENISKYIDISDIINLYESGSISIQFMSDIIRMRLLRKYGGFWCDSTIAVANPDFFDKVRSKCCFFSIKLAEFQDWSSVTKGFVSSYFWGSCPNNPFFSYVDDMFTYFIKKHEKIIDYFQIDFTVMAGYYHIPFIKNLIDMIPPSNNEIFVIGNLLNREFKQDKWNKLTASNDIFKLNWRKRIKNRDNSYWSYLCKILSKT